MTDLTDYVDGFDINTLLTQIQQKGKVTDNSPLMRYWSTPARYSNDTTREVMEVTFNGPRLVNSISLQAARFPHRITVEWLDEDHNQWVQFTTPVERPTIPVQDIPVSAIQFLVAESSPGVISTATSETSGEHPQHFGDSHWITQEWEVVPVTCTTVRFILTRVNIAGTAPTTTSGFQAAYPLAIKDLQIGYRIDSRDKVPRYPTVDPSSGVFASSIDLLGSRLGYSLWEQPATQVTDGDPQTAWRSEPQPVNYAVVNMYADVRRSSGQGQIIDRFFVDPLTPGVHFNLYVSTDTPTGDFEALDEPLTYPVLQTSLGLPQYQSFQGDPSANNVLFSGAYADIENNYLQFDDQQDWWIGFCALATTDYSDDGEYPWMSFGGNFLRQRAGRFEFISASGENVVLPLPEQHIKGTRFSLAIIHEPRHGYPARVTLVYQTADFDPIIAEGRLQHPLAQVDDVVRLGGYEGASAGTSKMRLRAMIVKNVAPADGEIDWFLDAGPDFIAKALTRHQDTFSTLNALLRLHTMFVTESTPVGLVGGPGDQYEVLSWKPVLRNYRLRRGILNISPTRAKFFKFEFSNLVAEHYEAFIPINRKVRMFSQQTVADWLGTASANKKASDVSGMASATDANANAGQFYQDTILALSGYTPPPGPSDYSPTEALAITDDPVKSNRIAETGWIWRYQPWHLGSGIPQFMQEGQHSYQMVNVSHRTKTGYYVGLKTLQAYRVDYLVGDDTEVYVDHFYDLANVDSKDSFILEDDGQFVAQANYCEAISEQFKSFQQVGFVQYATQQSPANQVLDDDMFQDPTSTDWTEYGDASLERHGPAYGNGRMVVNRGWRAKDYSSIEGDTYSDLEADYYGTLEGGLPNGMSEGGICSRQVAMGGGGRIYAAVRVSTTQRLHGPITLEIVGVNSNIVLASVTRTLFVGEQTDMWVGYTPGSVSTRLTYQDLEDAQAYIFLEHSGSYFGPPSMEVPVTYTYGDWESETVREPVSARIKQNGQTDDSFTVHRFSIFDDPIEWSFSVDDGATWYPAVDIRNNPHGVMRFPTTGRYLRWRVRAFKSGATISALSIRPWYYGFPDLMPQHRALEVDGPNASAVDRSADVELDPMWQQWDSPIPSWWYQGLEVNNQEVVAGDPEPLTFPAIGYGYGPYGYIPYGGS